MWYSVYYRSRRLGIRCPSLQWSLKSLVVQRKQQIKISPLLWQQHWQHQHRKQQVSKQQWRQQQIENLPHLLSHRWHQGPRVATSSDMFRDQKSFILRWDFDFLSKKYALNLESWPILTGRRIFAKEITSAWSDMDLDTKEPAFSDGVVGKPVNRNNPVG